MKKLFTLITFIVTFATFAQAPQGFNYQATVRNSLGALIVNQNVYFKFNIMLNSQTSIPIYSETHYVPTDDLGQVNCTIGQGTATTGTFSAINWGTGNYYLGIELNTGSGYVAMGTTQLLSVPYALYANSAGSNNIANGTTVGEMLFWNGTQWALNPSGLPGQILYVNESNLPTWGFSPVITNGSCFGSNNGAIHLNLPTQFSSSYYTYQWTGPNNFSSNAPNINNLFPGIYSLVLTHNGVSTTQNYTITEPQDFVIENSNNVNVTCYGLNNGQCTVNVTQGSIGNYTFTIDGVNYLGNNVFQSVTQSSQTYTFLGLAAGTYNIGVTANTGCYKNINNVVITQPNSPYSIVGTYHLTATRLDVNTIYDLPNEDITEVSSGTYLTSSTGPYNTRGLISAGAQLSTTTPGFTFNIVCGTNQVIVPTQQLGNVYSNLVQQSPTQAAASFVDSNGTITIEYSVWFTGNTVERPYRGVYIPN